MVWRSVMRLRVGQIQLLVTFFQAKFALGQITQAPIFKLLRMEGELGSVFRE